MIKYKMDELTRYLQINNSYNKKDLEQILNTKIIINKNHIQNIKANAWYNFNIVQLFEIYGYIFTDNDYISLLYNNGCFLRWMCDDKKTDKLCKIAVQQNGILKLYKSV